MQKILDRRRRISYTAGDFYISYIKHVENSPRHMVSMKVFKAVMKDYIDDMMHKIIWQSKEVKLPCRLGYLSVVKHRPTSCTKKKLGVDYASTKEYGKPIYHMNEHSDGYKYMFYWRKYEMVIRHKFMYEICLSRTNKRKLARAIKENKQDYLERR